MLDVATFPLRTCYSHQDVREVWRDRSVRHLGQLAVRRQGRIVGVLDRTSQDESDRISRRMTPLDEKRLISAEAPLMDFVRVAVKTPYRLVVQGTALAGIITRGDLRKPAAGMLARGLVEEIEALMGELIRQECGTDEEAFLRLLSEGRRRLLEEKRANLEAEGSEVERLGLAELCDKREIVRKLFRLGQDFSIELRRVEMFRNALPEAGGAPSSPTYWRSAVANLLAAEERLEELRGLRARGE